MKFSGFDESVVWLSITALFTGALLLIAYYLGALAPPPPKIVPPPNNVKVLSWWGYFSDGAKLREIEERCQANIQLEEYFQIEDFYSLIQREPYDIYIYPHYAYPQIQALQRQGPEVAHHAQQYHPGIYKRYYAEGFDKDTLFFQHAVSAFIYDRKIISDLKTLKPYHIFKFAQQGRVVLQRDFEQLHWLFGQESRRVTEIYWDRLFDFVVQKKIILSNFASNFSHNDLVLGYLDSGELHNFRAGWTNLKNTDGKIKDLTMGIHPKFSYVTSDLISLKDYRLPALCVGRILISPEFLQWISETSYYYSPFGDLPKHIWSPNFAQEFFDNIDTLAWDSLRKIGGIEHNPHALAIWNKISICYRNKKICFKRGF